MVINELIPGSLDPSSPTLTYDIVERPDHRPARGQRRLVLLGRVPAAPLRRAGLLLHLRDLADRTDGQRTILSPLVQLLLHRWRLAHRRALRQHGEHRRLGLAHPATTPRPASGSAVTPSGPPRSPRTTTRSSAPSAGSPARATPAAALARTTSTAAARPCCTPHHRHGGAERSDGLLLPLVLQRPGCLAQRRRLRGRDLQQRRRLLEPRGRASARTASGTAGGWIQNVFRVSSVLTPTSQMQHALRRLGPRFRVHRGGRHRRLRGRRRHLRRRHRHRSTATPRSPTPAAARPPSSAPAPPRPHSTT